MEDSMKTINKMYISDILYVMFCDFLNAQFVTWLKVGYLLSFVPHLGRESGFGRDIWAFKKSILI